MQVLSEVWGNSGMTDNQYVTVTVETETLLPLVHIDPGPGYCQ